MNYEFSEGYKIRNQSALHFLTLTVVGWIDVFTRLRYRDILLGSMEYCRKNKGLRIGAYVVMSNHVHVIWQAEKSNLSDIVRDFKTYSSKAITTEIENGPESRKEWLLYMFNYHSKKTNANDYYKFWTGNNHPEEIFSESFMRSKLNYIHDNPVRAGIVENPEDYLYSSARDYHTGRRGLVEIDFLY